MAAARRKGTHTKEQWEALLIEFEERCVRCERDEWQLERDHITPIYQGGSDGIDNIQPLCARCNASKGPEDYNWKEYRRKHGWTKAVAQSEFLIIKVKRLCTRCHRNPVYLDIKSMDVCSDCIWEIVQEEN